MSQGAASTLPSDTLQARLRVLRAVNALSSIHPLAQRRFRSLSYSGFFLCLSGLVTVWLVGQIGASDVADVLALRILAYACWLYGGFGLWILLSPGAFEGSGLARLRGLSIPLGLSCFVTLTLKLFKSVSYVGLPAVALAAFSAGDDPTRSARLTQLGWCVVYVLIFAMTVALVGALCIWLTPRRARTSAVSILLIPFGVDLTFGAIPNLISGLVWGMGQLISVGAP